MSTEAEVERLVVRLVGDGSDFMGMIQEAIAASADLARVEQQLTRVEQERDAAMAKGAAIAASVKTAGEVYADQVFELNSLLAQGAVTEETYRRAMDKVGQSYRVASGEAARLAKIEADKQQAIYAAQQRGQSFMAEGTALTLAHMNAQERHSSQLARLNTLYEGGFIGQTTYNRALKEADATLRVANTGLSTFSNNLTMVGANLTMVGASITALSGGFATLGVMSAGQFEQTTIAFETMMGSAGEAKALLDNLTEFAAKTPFEMPEIEQAARGLVMFGEGGKGLMDTLNLLGNAAAGTSTQFGFLALVYNQVRGVGKLLTQDFRQLSTRGILSLADIAKYFNVTEEAANKMLSTGQIKFEDLRGILASLSQEGGRFFNLMERQSESFLGKASTLKDAFNIFLRQIGQEILPVAKTLLQAILNIVDKLSNLPKPLKVILGLGTSLVAVTGALITTFGATALAIGGLAVALNLYNTYLKAYITLTLLAEIVTAGLLVAVMAFTAMIGYGIYKAVSATEDYNAELEKGKKLSQEIRDIYDQQTKGILSNVETLAPDQRKDYLSAEVDKADKAANQYKQTLDAANQKLQEMAPTWMSLWMSQWGNAEYESLPATIEDLQQRMVQAKERAKELRAALTKLGEDAKIEEARKGLVKYVEKLKEAIATMNMSPEEAALYKATNGQQLTPEEMQGARDLAAQEKEMENQKALNKYIDETIAKLQQEADMAGMTDTEKLAYQMRKKAESLGLEMPQEFIDQAIHAKEVADEVKRVADEKKKLTDDTKNLTKSLQEQVETFGMDSSAIAIYKLQMRGATEEELAAAKAAAARLKELKEHEALVKRGKDLVKQYMTPAQKLAESKKELDNLLSQSLIDIDTYTRALADAEKQANKDYVANFGVTGVDAVAAGSLEALARFEQYQAGLGRGRQAQTALAPTGMRPVENPMRANRESHNSDRMVDSLSLIATILQRQLDRPQIILEAAGFTRN